MVIIIISSSSIISIISIIIIMIVMIIMIICIVISIIIVYIICIVNIMFIVIRMYMFIIYIQDGGTGLCRRGGRQRGILYYSTPREESFTILLPERNPLLFYSQSRLPEAGRVA